MTGPLTENQKKLLALFREAIEKERAAQEFYAQMLGLSQEPTLKRVIESFIREEKGHEEKLMEKYTELRQIDEFKDAM
jgi:rubrerythrin